MARLFLGEPMTPVRIAFVIAGAVGMLLIVRPGSSVFQGAAAYALLAALFYAGYQILTRLLAGENPRVLLFYPAIIGTLVMSLLAPGFDWPASMPWTHVVLIICRRPVRHARPLPVHPRVPPRTGFGDHAVHLHAARLGDAGRLDCLSAFPGRVRRSPAWASSRAAGW